MINPKTKKSMIVICRSLVLVFALIEVALMLS